MKAFALLTVALALGAFAAEVPAERLDPTVMPFGLDACGDDVEALARRLRDIRSRSGIRQFVLYAPCQGDLEWTDGRRFGGHGGLRDVGFAPDARGHSLKHVR